MIAPDAPFLTGTQEQEPAPRVTEAVLVTRAQRGDHDAFTQLHARYERRIWNYLYRLMGRRRDDADEMTQDTFLKAWLALPDTSDDLRFQRWIYRIAQNVALDELRHRKLIKWTDWATFLANAKLVGQAHLLVAPDSPEDDALDRENRRETTDLLADLPANYRQVLLLREYYDLSYDEIAARLGTTRPAVKSLLFRARVGVRAQYARQPRRPEVLPRRGTIPHTVLGSTIRTRDRLGASS